MAIEKDINPTALNEQNQVPLGQEDMTVAIEAIRDRGTEGFEIQEDGSAILAESITEEIETGFDENLAEVLLKSFGLFPVLFPQKETSSNQLQSQASLFFRPKKLKLNF